MRFLRLSYLVPRLVLLMLLLLATEVGSGYAVRWGIVSGGQAAVGAKVEVASVKASLLETRLLVGDVAVANPNSPMKNLFEADRIEIDFSSNALLRKKLVADYGIISGLEFSTQRETSGEIPAAELLESGAAEESWIVPVAGDFAEDWLTDLEGRLTRDLRQQFQSVRLAEKLAEKWPQKYRALERKAKQIKTEAKRLEEEVRAAKKNPLRHVEFLARVPQESAKLRSSLRELQTDLAAMPLKIAADREAIAAARKHDEELIRRSLELDTLNAKALTNYLLGEEIAGPLNETIAWVRWARRLVPPRGAVQAEPADRGENVMFAGCEQLPNMLVRAVRIEGNARMGGQPVELVGVMRDWTTQPELHQKPTTLELTAKGGLPLTMQARFDRTRSTPEDQFYCSTSDLLVPQMKLGKRDKLQLAIAPARATATVRLRLVGERLSGEVLIDQQNLEITPTVAPGVLAGRLQSSLAENVSRINHANTRVTLAGTLDSPEVQFDSTLGTALVQAINRAATDVVAAEQERLLARGQQELDTQLAKLDDEFQQFQSKVTSELDVPGDILAGLLEKSGAEQEISRSPFGQFFKK